MKNRSSTPVDVLKALVLPITWVVTPGAPSGVRDDTASGSISGGGRKHELGQILFPREGLPDVAHLPCIVEQHDPHLTGDGDQVLGVEQQALVAAEHDLRAGHGRPDRADVEAADAVFAAEEQPLEDRQVLLALLRRVFEARLIANRRMYSVWARKPNDVRGRCRLK